MIQRYNAPESNNKFYLNVSGGGYNRCIKISGYSVLPNCVGYAYGRFLEESNITTCSLSAGDAENWWDYPDGYPRGQTPKQGAVMCWRKGAAHYGEDGRGHVEVVEQVNPDGSVITTGSNYGGTRWYRHTRVKPYAISGQTFQGFIYNPHVNDIDIPFGSSELKIGNNSYSLYRQNPDKEYPAVLSAGLDKVLPISKLDADVNVMAKATGANFFQAKEDQADPKNTTYGDFSAPLNDVWRQLPNQNTTLYYDLEEGMYGDCTGISINKEHNVFSPAVVYPETGNYQYARMVGISHVNVVSRYTFSIRLKDGSYVLGLALQDCTPKQIAEDFKTVLAFHSIAFLDGGGSAQFGRVNTDTGKFEYVRDTGRACPSAVAIISKKPLAPVVQPVPTPVPPVQEPQEPSEPTENQPTNPETGESEDLPMEQEKPVETPEMTPVEGWTDPEPTPNDHIILNRIASLMSVKSIITIFLTVVFGMLVLRGEELPDKFVSIYTMCISFFFGYQFKKAEGGGDK